MRYNSLNNYLRNKFGKKVYKISIDGGFTCPNRDGKISTGGCIFCSAKGSGDFATSKSLSITQQIEQGKERVRSKTKDNSFIAYFQAFTNTYAPIDVLESKFTEAINHKDIVALSVATRPDCVDDNVLKLLEIKSSLYGWSLDFKLSKKVQLIISVEDMKIPYMLIQQQNLEI